MMIRAMRKSLERENVAFATVMPRRKKPHERPNQQNGETEIARKIGNKCIGKIIGNNYIRFEETPQQYSAVPMRDLNNSRFISLTSSPAV